MSHLDSKDRGPWSESSGRKEWVSTLSMGHTLTHTKQQQARGSGEQTSCGGGSWAAGALRSTQILSCSLSHSIVPKSPEGLQSRRHPGFSWALEGK